MAYPSTFADLQSNVLKLARLDASGAALDTQMIKDRINLAYYETVVEAEALPSFSTMALTANAARYTLPAAVARIKNMYVTPAGQTDVQGEQPPLVPTTLEDIQQRRAYGQLVATAGQYPTRYCLVGQNVFEVWPTPAGADVITIYYATFPTALVNAGDLPAIDEPYATKCLEYGALLHLGDLTGDPSTAGWQQSYDQWLARYVAHLAQKSGDIPTQFHQWGGLRDTKELYGWP